MSYLQVRQYYRKAGMPVLLHRVAVVSGRNRLNIVGLVLWFLASCGSDPSYRVPETILGVTVDEAGSVLGGVQILPLDAMILERDGLVLRDVVYGKPTKSLIDGTFKIGSHASSWNGVGPSSTRIAVEFRHSEYATLRLPIEAVLGTGEPVIVELQRAGRIAGRVEGALSGWPLVAVASTTPHGLQGGLGWRRVAGVDQQGEFEISNLGDRAVYLVLCEDLRGADAGERRPFLPVTGIIEVHVDSGSEVEVGLLLADYPSISGRIISDPEFAGAVASIVMYENVRDPGGGQRPIARFTGQNNGVFSMPNPTAVDGDYFLRVYATPSRYTDYEVAVEPGQNVELERVLRYPSTR